MEEEPLQIEFLKGFEKGALLGIVSNFS